MFVVLCSYMCTISIFVFFFKQKTAYEMRISDWSSDVCSSDLIDTSLPDPTDLPDPAAESTVLLFDLDGTITDSFAGIENSFRHALDTVGTPQPDQSVEIGRASCRERVCQYV